MKSESSMSPPARLIRMGKAPAYLGMCRAVFNKTVRPFLTELPIGKQGIAFDREQLDEWATWFRQSQEAQQIDKRGSAGNDSSRSERRHSLGATKLWGKKQSQAFSSGKASGTSISRSATLDAFAKALERATGKKPKPI